MPSVNAKDIESWIISALADLLKIKPSKIDRNETFETYGLNSVAAVELIGQLEERLDCEISATLAYEHPTPADLARHLAETSYATPARNYPTTEAGDLTNRIENLSLAQRKLLLKLLQEKTNGASNPKKSAVVSLQPKGSKRPLFLIHPLHGNVLCYVELARQLGQERPVYGLQAPALVVQAQPDTQIETMAAHYIEAMRIIQPEGPYQLGGWSMGGAVAFEIAQQLHQRGQKVSLLVLLDTWIRFWPDGDSSKLSEQERHALLVSWLGWDLGIRFGKNIRIRYKDLIKRDPAKQLSFLLAEAAKAQALPPGLENARHFEICQAHAQAYVEYEPKLYADQIVLVRALDLPLDVLADYWGEAFSDVVLKIREMDPTLGWRDFCSGSIIRKDISGNHFSIIAKPGVEDLALQLKNLMNDQESGEQINS